MEHYNLHEISITVYDHDNHRDRWWAEIEAYSYPDGSVRNKLDPDELREVAEKLNEAADYMEED